MNIHTDIHTQTNSHTNKQIHKQTNTHNCVKHTQRQTQLYKAYNVQWTQRYKYMMTNTWTQTHTLEAKTMRHANIDSYRHVSTQSQTL